MFSYDKFRTRRMKSLVAVKYSVSMNLAPTSEFSKEETRVGFRMHQMSDDEFIEAMDFVIKMSRAEAKVLGERLLQYGNAKIEGE